MEILARRFGKKIKLPPTVQIKREICFDGWRIKQR